MYKFPTFYNIGSTLKNKYNHIKSSGYGQQSPGRTPSKERPSSARERGTLRTEEHRGAQHGGKDRAPERAGKKERRLREVGQQEQPWSPVDISRQKIIGNYKSPTDILRQKIICNYKFQRTFHDRKLSVIISSSGHLTTENYL